MKKKILKAGILLLMMLCIMGNVYGLEYKVTMNASKTEVPKNEEFTVDVNVSDIESEKGVISFGGTLEYDKDSLELVKFEGKNKWETPVDGSSFNSEEGIIAIVRSGVSKSNETMFTMTFKPKENAKQDLTIELRDVMVADGTTPVKKDLVKTDIKIVAASTSTPTPTPTPTSNPTPTPTGSPVPTTQPSTIPTAKPTPTPVNKLPQTGEGTFGTVLVFGGAVTVAVAIFFFVEMKLVRK